MANKAFDPNDPSAQSLPAKTPRFAENANTLYRNSLDGHANLGCESCHGSPHAIWPNRKPDANDNITATQLQGLRARFLNIPSVMKIIAFLMAP